VDPFDALSTYGADAIRWYFYTNSAPWLPNRFYGRAVVEGQRKFMGTLWNTYAFWTLYADIDSFDPTKYSLKDCALTVMDRFILSRLQTSVAETDNHLENYRIPEAAKALSTFVDELSNWYVRRCRERFWGKDMTEDKIAAYMTLYTCLVTIAKASAPMIPFMAEDIYQNLVRTVDEGAPESIHLCDYPVSDASYIDKKLEDDMEFILDVVVLGRSARNGSNIKNRQPLANMYVKTERTVDGFYREIVEDELNVKHVEFVTDVSAFSSYSFKPQLKTVGPKYGKLLGKIKAALSEVDGNAAKNELDTTGALKFNFDGEEVVLTEADLLIEVQQKEGYFSAADHGIVAALDTNLTPELIEEGFMREIISKIQTMRKDADFEVTDHIRVTIAGSEKLAAIVENNRGEIASAVLADSFGDAEGGVSKNWNINGEDVTVTVSRI